MSAFALKIIAMVTMFIDHLFASCIDPYGVDVWNISRHIVPGTGTTLYWIGRMIGRIAFPIFCFQIVEGVRYTKNWKRYMARLALLALISEIPFDLALKNFQIDMSSQNVFLTLLFGMMIVTFMKVVDQDWCGQSLYLDTVTWQNSSFILTMTGAELCASLSWVL